MKKQGKSKKAKKKEIIVSEDLRKFFPPISRMGRLMPSHWKQINPGASEKVTRVPV